MIPHEPAAPQPAAPQPAAPPPAAVGQPGAPWHANPPAWPPNARPPRARGGVPRWSLVRTPAFWILGVVTALCALVLGGFTVFSVIDMPVTFLVVVLMVTASGVVWTAGLLRIGDPVERRPAWLVAAALVWGGSVAAAAGGSAGYTLDILVARGISPAFAAQWGAAIAAPYAEELGKGAGVVALLLVARPFLTTVWSGAAYGALVGLGFMLYEDIGYAMFQADDVLPDDLGGAVDILVLRALVPGLVGHPLFTATAGAGIAYAWLRYDRSRRRRIGVLLAALLGAALMHATVNSPLAFAPAVALGDQQYASYMAGYLLVVGVVSLPCLWWLATVRRADALMLLERADDQVPDALHPSEIATLAGLRTRRAAARRFGREHGADAARRLRRLQRAQVRLAGSLARPHNGYPAVGPNGPMPQVQRWQSEILAARADLSEPATLPDLVTPTTTPSDAPSPGTPSLQAPSSEVVSPVTVRGWRRPVTVVAAAVLVCALAGVAYWPVGVLALIAALPLALRRDAGVLARVAVASSVFGGYSALATLVTDRL